MSLTSHPCRRIPACRPRPSLLGPVHLLPVSSGGLGADIDICHLSAACPPLSQRTIEASGNDGIWTCVSVFTVCRAPVSCSGKTTWPRGVLPIPRVEQIARRSPPPSTRLHPHLSAARDVGGAGKVACGHAVLENGLGTPPIDELPPRRATVAHHRA